MNFKAVLALPKTARSTQNHKIISFIWSVWSTLYVYLWLEGHSFLADRLTLSRVGQVSQLWDTKDSKTLFCQTDMVLSFHLSSWSAGPPELHSLFRSSLEVADTQKCDGFGTNFQHLQFLTYRHVMHLKKFLKSYWLHNWNKKCQYLWENNVFDHFLQNIVLF